MIRGLDWKEYSPAVPEYVVADTFIWLQVYAFPFDQWNRRRFRKGEYRSFLKHEDGAFAEAQELFFFWRGNPSPSLDQLVGTILQCFRIEFLNAFLFVPLGTIEREVHPLVSTFGQVQMNGGLLSFKVTITGMSVQAEAFVNK